MEVFAMKIKRRSQSPLQKKAKRGFQGYPVATVAFYGPDDLMATKVAVGIVEQEDADPSLLERWFSEAGDVRADAEIELQVLEFIVKNQVRSVIVTDGIIGCPHEEVIDYP